MGRTSKPLRILVTDNQLLLWEEIAKLATQGHVVQGLFTEGEVSSAEWDLVLGPTCHMMTEAERPWLKDAVAAARKRRYGVPLTQEEDAS